MKKSLDGGARAVYLPSSTFRFPSPRPFRSLREMDDFIDRVPHSPSLSLSLLIPATRARVCVFLMLFFPTFHSSFSFFAFTLSQHPNRFSPFAHVDDFKSFPCPTIRTVKTSNSKRPSSYVFPTRPAIKEEEENIPSRSLDKSKWFQRMKTTSASSSKSFLFFLYLPQRAEIALFHAQQLARSARRGRGVAGRIVQHGIAEPAASP